MRNPLRNTTLRVLAATVALAAAASATFALADTTATPTDRAAEPLCGTNPDRQEGDNGWQPALDRADKRFGGLESVRVFYDGLPQAWPGKVDTGDRPMTVSFKTDPRDIIGNTGGTLDKLRGWFADAPTDKDVFWTYYHEPEDNIENKEFSVADYRKAWQLLARAADESGNKRLKATLILMSWTLDPRSGREWSDYYPGAATIDVLGWDAYSRGKDTVPYQSATTMFDPIVAIAEAEGKPFAIGEVGSGLAKGDDGTGRAAWLRQIARYLTEHGAVFVQYFDTDWRSHGTVDYRLRDKPSIAAWKQFCD